MSKDVIEPGGIPLFTGNLEQLTKDAAALTKQAGDFRDGASNVHTEFQGLSACYHAPEADQLFATTLPVKTRADSFAGDLEKAAAALTAYEGEVRPIVDRLAGLRTEAFAFTDSIAGDDHWRRDQKKVDHNERLMNDVAAAVAAFTAAERTCHDKITALVGGSKLTTDDGSHKDGMYGYSEDALKHAEETPWGGHAEREYTGLAWVWHQVKSFVWDGFIVDGIWGTVKGLGTLVGTDGWDKAGQAWTGLAKLATGLAITSTPLAGLYWAAPDKSLPSWLRDSRTAVKETGKALVAWDEWGKNPARAAGSVTFNVLTTVFTGGSGTAAKTGAVAKVLSVTGKVAKVVDPMTYVAKAGKLGIVKVGDLLSGLKNIYTGTYKDALPGLGHLNDIKLG
ncbi:protein phosphatase, partial [Streptomyces sp. NPDC094438]